jgi:hypothetical protein
MWLSQTSVWQGKIGMPLQSRLFRGVEELEACLVRDPAHILLGAQGDHVGKIQLALRLTDLARIVPGELADQSYGPATASAVLSYKQKRRIINFAYETKADNIVGKMTIATLDREMILWENTHRNFFTCGDPVAPGQDIRPPVFAISSTPPGVTAPVADTPKFPAALDIMWQITEAGVARGGKRHEALIDHALEILRPFGMSFFARGPFPDPVPLPDKSIIDPRFQIDTLQLRNISEKRFPGSPKTLRVIVCPFDSSSSDSFGVTIGSPFDGQTFRPFILINVNNFREDRRTFLHEMIHAATGLQEIDHDTDVTSVFSVGHNRTVLSTKFAEALSKSFFAL